MIRVLIADDQGMVRTGFTVFLGSQPDIEVVGEAADGPEAIERAAALRPDVILMDASAVQLAEAVRVVAAGEALIARL